MANSSTNPAFSRASFNSSPLTNIPAQFPADDYSQISFVSMPNALLTEDDKLRLIAVSALERHFNSYKRRVLEFGFMKLQENLNNFLRLKIALTMIKRLIKNHEKALKEQAFIKLSSGIGKRPRALKIPKAGLQGGLSHIEDESLNAFDILNSYLKETTPNRFITKRAVDKAFSAQKLLNCLHFLFREARTKKYAFNILKRPIFFSTQPRSISLDMSYSTNRNERIPFEPFFRDIRNSKDQKRESILSGIKKLSDFIYSYKGKVFSILREKTKVARRRNENQKHHTVQEAYISKVSQFFSYKQNRKLKSIDYSHIKHMRQSSDYVRGNNHEWTVNSSDSPNTASFGYGSPMSYNLSQRFTDSDSSPVRALAPKRLNSEGHNYQNPDDSSVSPRDSLIKEKLMKVVLKPKPAFKDKQVERYLRYEHTFYQILRVFKGALKRELYYSFENLKNWGNLDPRTHRCFVKILNRWRGRTQQLLHSTLMVWRDNAKRRQIVFMTLRNFVSVINIRKNVILEKSLLHLQLVVWFSPQFSPEKIGKPSKFDTPNFKLSKHIEFPINGLHHPSRASKGAILIIQRIMRTKLQENKAQAFRELRLMGDRKKKKEIQIEKAAQISLNTMLRQGGPQFFANLRKFYAENKDFDQDEEERDSGEFNASSEETRNRKTKENINSEGTRKDKLKAIEAEDNDSAQLKNNKAEDKPREKGSHRMQEDGQSWSKDNQTSRNTDTKLSEPHQSHQPENYQERVSKRKPIRTDSDEEEIDQRQRGRGPEESQEWNSKRSTNDQRASLYGNKEQTGPEKVSRKNSDEGVISPPRFIDSKASLENQFFGTDVEVISEVDDDDSIIQDPKSSSSKHRSASAADARGSYVTNPAKSQNDHANFAGIPQRKLEKTENLKQSGALKYGAIKKQIDAHTSQDSHENQGERGENDFSEDDDNLQNANDDKLRDSNSLSRVNQYRGPSHNLGKTKSPKYNEYDTIKKETNATPRRAENTKSSSNYAHQPKRDANEHNATNLDCHPLSPHNMLIENESEATRDWESGDVFGSSSNRKRNDGRDDSNSLGVQGKNENNSYAVGQYTNNRAGKMKNRDMIEDPAATSDERTSYPQTSAPEKGSISKFLNDTSRGILGTIRTSSTQSHSKKGTRILPKVLERVVPRLYKSLFLQKLREYCEMTEREMLDSQKQGDREKNPTQTSAIFYLVKTLDLVVRFKRKMRLSAAFHDILHYCQEYSLQVLHRNYSERFHDAQRRQSTEFFAKVIDNVARTYRYRTLSRAFNLLKSFDQRKLFTENVKAIKLKSIIQKRWLVNMAYAFK